MFLSIPVPISPFLLILLKKRKPVQVSTGSDCSTRPSVSHKYAHVPSLIYFGGNMKFAPTLRCMDTGYWSDCTKDALYWEKKDRNLNMRATENLH